MEQVSNTSFLVNLTNAYCLLRKIKLHWKDACSNLQTKETLTIVSDTAIKLTIQICSEVLQRGIVARIGVFSKNHAIIQNKIA
jgi:hypothetical protein